MDDAELTEQLFYFIIQKIILFISLIKKIKYNDIHMQRKIRN